MTAPVGLSQSDAGSWDSLLRRIIIGLSGTSVVLAVATADVTPDSVVYNRSVSPGMTIDYTESVTRDGGGSATVSIGTDGVPLVSGDYGTYEISWQFNGGAIETYIVSHYDEATLEAMFSLPAQDSNKRSIFTPASDTRLLYVDQTLGDDVNWGPTGDGSDYYLGSAPPGGDWENPGTVNAFASYDAAYAEARDGYQDWILLKRGEKFEPTDRLVLGISGKSSTERAMVIAYGSGAKPLIAPTSALTSQCLRLTNSNNWGFIGLDFYQDWRDPNSGNFAGYGYTLGCSCISILSTTQNVSGVIIEDCTFRHVEQGVSIATSSTWVDSDIIYRRNISRYIYSEFDNTEPFLAGSASLMIEYNIHDYGGWLIDRDAVTWPTGASESGTHTGGTSSTTLTDSGQSMNWASADWSGVVITNTTTGASGVASASTSTTITVTLTGGSRQDWQIGDTYTIDDVTKTHGQATGFNHDFYLSFCDNTIVRKNIIGRGATCGIKLAAKQTLASIEYAGHYMDNFVIRDNLFFDHEYGISAGGNLSFDVNARFKDGRIMNNVFYKMGHSEHGGNDFAFGVWMYDWQDGWIGKNIFTKFASGRNSWFGLVFARHMLGTKGSRNIFYDLGDASGTSTGENRGAMSFNSSIGTATTGTTSGVLEDTGSTAFATDDLVGLPIYNATDGSSGTITANTAHTISASLSGGILNQFSSGDRYSVGPYYAGNSWLSQVGFYYNEIQMQNTDAPIYGDFVSDSDVTLIGQIYKTLGTDPYEIDETPGSYAEWVSATSETGSSETEISYVEARTIETYQTSLAKTATIDAFVDDVQSMMDAATWDADYDPETITQYFRDGYKAAA